MSLYLVTAPALEPVTVAEAKTHLRIDGSGSEPAPAALTAALVSPAAAGNVDNGAHRYRVTFVTADGETDGGVVSSAVTVADKTANGKVALTAIPTGGGAVTSRKIYRTQAGGSTYLLLTTIADNTTTTYTDNTADSALGAGAPTTNTTQDPYVSALISAARQYAETVTNRALLEQTWDLKMDAFPIGDIVIPKPPLQSITSISYVDGDGVTQTWASSNYTVDAPSGDWADYGRIARAYQVSYPSTRAVINAVTVRLVCGYGDAAADVPEAIRQAILQHVAEMYEQRRDATEGVTGKASFTVDNLLWPYRLMRWS